MSTFRTGMMKLGHGLVLSYAEQGAAERPALLLLHGYSDSWRSYQPLMAPLSNRFRVIAVSLRGHGDSSTPSRGYDLPTISADVVAFIKMLGIGKATIVGHSMGSLVSQWIALHHRQFVDKLIFIGAFATLKGNASVEALWRDEVQHLLDPVAPEFVRAFQQSTLAVPVPSAFFESVVAESLKVASRVWRGALLGLLEHDHCNRLHEIFAPSLIIWGDQDRIAGRADQDLLAKSMPNARLAIHSGIGHAPHWEDPDRVLAHMIPFFENQGQMAA